MARIELEELVVHRFYSLDLGLADESYASVRALWLGWQAPLGRPIVGTELPIDAPETLRAVPNLPADDVVIAGQENAPGDRQALLRRRHDVLVLSVGFSGHQFDESRVRRRRLPTRPSWTDLDRLWQELAGEADEFVLGEARLYLGTASDLSDVSPDGPVARAVRRRLPPGGTVPEPWSAPARTRDGLVTWEAGRDTGAILRRILVLGPPGPRANDALSEWTWSDGRPDTPPLARYFVQAAKLRREKRRWDRGLTAGGSPDRMAGTAESDTVLADLVERRRYAEITAANMAAYVPDEVATPATLFGDDRVLGRWLQRQLTDDIVALEADAARAVAPSRAPAAPEAERPAPTTRSASTRRVRPSPDPVRRTMPRATADGDDLDDPFGTKAASALREWAATVGGEVRSPLRGWRSRNPHTGAVLAYVVLERRTGSDKLMAKLCPAGAGYENEAGLAHRAAADFPQAAARHFVRQAFPAYPVGDGRRFMLMDLAGDPLEVRTLADLPAENLGAACTAAIKFLLRVWNDVRQPRVLRAPAGEFLGRELRGTLEDEQVRAWAGQRGLFDPAAVWIRIGPAGEPAPNPFLLVDELTEAGTAIDFLAGYSHGDFHLGNVLVPWRTPVLLKLKVIDFSAYEPEAPLSRDVASLLLAVIAPHLRGDLSADAADELLDLVTGTRETGPMHLPPSVDGPVQAILGAADLVPAQWRSEWRPQYLLSLVAQALTHLTYEDVGAAGHWWCFRLATRAAWAFHQEHPLSPPIDIRLVTEPG